MDPKGTRNAEWRAAADLVKYIHLMAGARPRLAATREEIDAALSGSSPVLLVGEEAVKAKPALAQRIRAAAKKNPILGADAIGLLREGNRVYLAGNHDEAHYYAVAELLWRWGCRWYMPTDFGECIPEVKTLTLGELDVDLSGKLKAGKNTIALRANCEHHFGGMFRRPLLYRSHE